MSEQGTTRHGIRRRRAALPSWIRVLASVVIIVIWFAVAAVGGPYFGRVGEVSSNEQTAYLPQSADATRVQEILAGFTASETIPAVLVFASDTALSEAQQAGIQRAIDGISGIEGVSGGVSPALLADDGTAAQAFVPIDATADIGDVVAAIDAEARRSVQPGTSVWVTGPAGFTSDLLGAFSGIDGILLLVALIAVFVILIAVYRSILLPVTVLLTSLFALTAALLSVWWLAKSGVLLLSGQTQGILFILVIGAATDYSLLYVSRYREALRSTLSPQAATRRALRGSWEPILASGGTVIAGLLCLVLSDLKSNSALGPVAAVGIAFAMIAALTFLPAVLRLLGRAAFWPVRPRYEPEVVLAEGGTPRAGLWYALGERVRRRPRAIWVTTALLLVIAAAGVTQLQASGVAQSDLVLGSSAARDGQAVLAAHFPGGSGSPVLVAVPEADLETAAELLLANDGVDAVSVLAADSPSGSAPVTSDGVGSLGGPGVPAPSPTVSDGRVMLEATLSVAADSEAAQSTVRELRSAIAGSGIDALVGGVTATAIDTDDASLHDRSVIMPLVLIVILLILMVVLRAILAPLLLVATTVLSFGAAIGVSAIVFNGVFRFPGADPAVPLYGFVFLVALGIDYNIFLATRIREEARDHGTREGVLRGLATTGGVITSAGLVLAATFAALAVIPILFLAQIAFIVAFGVLLDTFVVRALLVPALVFDIGPAVWWPSRLRVDAGRRPVPEQRGAVPE